MFEYVLLEGVNDSVEDAQALVDLVSDMRCHVNLMCVVSRAVVLEETWLTNMRAAYQSLQPVPRITVEVPIARSNGCVCRHCPERWSAVRSPNTAR